jgi:hypothetical protein
MDHFYEQNKAKKMDRTLGDFSRFLVSSAVLSRTTKRTPVCMVATVLRHEQQMELLGTLDFLGEAGVGESGATSTTPVIGDCVVGTTASAPVSFEILLVANVA